MAQAHTCDRSGTPGPLRRTMDETSGEHKPKVEGDSAVLNIKIKDQNTGEVRGRRGEAAIPARPRAERQGWRVTGWAGGARLWPPQVVFKVKGHTKFEKVRGR